jgi:hypothetical protein
MADPKAPNADGVMMPGQAQPEAGAALVAPEQKDAPSIVTLEDATKARADKRYGKKGGK